MKRIIGVALALLMTLSLFVTLASCGFSGRHKVESDTESETKEEMVTIELKLAGGELSDDDDDEW